MFSDGQAPLVQAKFPLKAQALLINTSGLYMVYITLDIRGVVSKKELAHGVYSHFPPSYRRLIMSLHLAGVRLNHQDLLSFPRRLRRGYSGFSILFPSLISAPLPTPVSDSGSPLSHILYFAKIPLCQNLMHQNGVLVP